MRPSTRTRRRKAAGCSKASPARIISPNALRSAPQRNWSNACGAESWLSSSKFHPASAAILASLHSPEVAFWIDGAMPFRGETTKGYVNGLVLALCAGPRCRAPWPQPRIQRLCWRRQYRKSLPLQSGFQERLHHGSQRHRDHAGSDPGNHGDHRRRPRGGNRLDRQFSLHAHQQIRIPPGQAVPLCRRRDAGVHPPGADGVCRFPRAGQGIFRSPRARGVALRLLDLRLRATHLDLHPDPGRGSLCNHGYRRHPHGELFRPARARVLPHRPGKGDRPDVSDGLVPADQRRHLHQRPGLFRSLVQCARPCGVRRRLFHCRSYHSCGNRRAEMSAQPGGRCTRTGEHRMQ